MNANKPSKLEKQPHLKWTNGKFKPQPPNPPPMIHVESSVMHSAHSTLGVHWKGSRKGIYSPRNIEALCDTGCQTCTAGEDFLTTMGIPKSYMIPTKHCIVGITDTSLGIMGAVMVRITRNQRTTRQMIYISSNVSGLFLSEEALKELGIISKSFPNVQPTGAFVCSKTERDEGCDCPPRTGTPPRPKSIPFPAIPENTDRLREWLINKFRSSAFNTCTNQPLQAMTGEPVDIRFKEGCHPVAVHTPIPVPHHWKYKVKADIDRDVRLGIIEPVPQGTATTWCSRMVVAPKKDGSPRRTVDLQQLNKATLRETHHSPTPFNIVSTIPKSKEKTILDAWNGYHSLLLSPSSKEATTFITEWGRYRYCRAPMGFHASGDAYTRRYDDITSEMERMRRCIDDTILWDDDITTAFWHTFDYLKLCADNGVVFNEEKFIFAKKTVEFAGFEVTEDGFRPPKRTIDSIAEFPTPKNITDVRSWFGFINQVAYSFAQAKIMAPFRELLSKKRKFYWDETLDEVFAASKKEIIRLIEEGVKTFEINRATTLMTDWSKTGVGFVLMQKYCNCEDKPATPKCGDGHWKLVFAGSRFTSETESHYAPIEGEALAVVHGLNSCRMFVLGCPQLTVCVDHKPLTALFNDRSLDTIQNPRIFSLKEKTLMYQFEIAHVPGKTHFGPDVTSRHPVGEKPQSSELEEEIESAAVAFATKQAEGSRSVSWDQVKSAAACDDECMALAQLIINGFPNSRANVPENLRQYWQMRDELYIIENVPFQSQKMLIPKSLRKEVLEGLHAAHQCPQGMAANARQRFFWPGINAAIKQKRLQCDVCNQNAPSQAAEPMIMSPPPEYPFQQTVMDIFSISQHDFLAYADRYSGWIELALLKNKSMPSIAECLRHWFTTFGAPEEISSDGGPPFNSSDYTSLLKSWDVRKRLSSAYYAQSNGRAEAAVKSSKRILQGNIDLITGKLNTDKVARAILSHRNTPVQETGISPAMSLFGRSLRDHLPNRQQQLRKEWRQIAEAREAALAKRHLATPLMPQKKSLEPLQVGQAIQIQNQRGNHSKKWSSTGVVVQVLPYRQYRVVVDGSRKVSLRNRRFLHPIDPVSRRQWYNQYNSPNPENSCGTDPGHISMDEPGLTTYPLNQNVNTIPHNTAEGSQQHTGDTNQNTTLEPDDVEATSINDIGDPEIEISDNDNTDIVEVPNRSVTLPRRSSRSRKQVQFFSPKMHGTSHE